jgi:hypothetical protein
MAIDIHSIYRQVFKIWRRRRFGLFLNVMEPKKEQTLLDVGGYPAFWVAYPQPVSRIDSLNLHEVTWDHSESPNHNIRTLVGNGCELHFPDGSYDIAFSNSVIEHVGSWDQQRKFAAEIRRVAADVWVQTPAFECLIEPHYMAPFIHYLPTAIQRLIVGWLTPWGWLERPSKKKIDFMVDTTRLVRKAEMKLLFPDCEIITERLLWVLPKSYIAVRHKKQQC